MRIAKYLAQCGIASRRKAEQLILDGKVEVNGQPIQDFTHPIDVEKDLISVLGRPVAPETHEYVLYYKPKGVLTTASDPQGRPTVVERVPSKRRLYPVGRLDRDTTGLVLLTNDGELAYRLTHPKFEVAKIYEAVVKGQIAPKAILRLKRGLWIEGKRCGAESVNVLFSDRQKTRLRLTLHEGRKHQVRRMLLYVGHPVIHLTRVAIGSLQLKGISAGGMRRLSVSEVQALRKKVGLA